jgi:hypothetical protein
MIKFLSAGNELPQIIGLGLSADNIQHLQEGQLAKDRLEHFIEDRQAQLKKLEDTNGFVKPYLALQKEIAEAEAFHQKLCAEEGLPAMTTPTPHPPRKPKFQAKMPERAPGAVEEAMKSADV